MAHRDGWPHWTRTAPPPPEQCDPWPGYTGRSRVLTGYGLTEVLGSAGATARAGSRWVRGWRRLSADLASPALLGRPWWQAWRSQQEPRQDGHDDAGPRWLTDVMREHAVAVLGGALPSHLLPADGDAPAILQAAVRPVVALADAVGMTRHERPEMGAPSPATLVFAALHPAVVGVALLLSADERSRWIDGSLYDAWPLRDLLAGRHFVMADLPAVARDRIYAAVFIKHRLAGQGATRELIDQVRQSPWVDHPQLSETIRNEPFRLRDSLALHRLIAAVAHYPGALLAEAPPKDES
jgi:hypothetical protein